MLGKLLTSHREGGGTHKNKNKTYKQKALAKPRWRNWRVTRTAGWHCGLPCSWSSCKLSASLVPEIRDLILPGLLRGVCPFPTIFGQVPLLLECLSFRPIRLLFLSLYSPYLFILPCVSLLQHSSLKWVTEWERKMIDTGDITDLGQQHRAGGHRTIGSHLSLPPQLIHAQIMAKYFGVFVWLLE